MALRGGSHGGFLAAHLSGQFPGKFRCVAVRNPVIDVASLSVESDIPDWRYTEVGEPYNPAGPINNEALIKMRNCSPIVHLHKVKVPTLIHTGSRDLRVPYHQAEEYFFRLKANGVDVRLNLYEDNHTLGRVSTELDHVINVARWFEEHLNKNSL